MSNIIKFPKGSFIKDEPSDFRKQVRKQKEHYVNNIVDQHSSSLLANIGLSGFKIENEQFMKDFAFTVETIRSALYRNMGLYHEFHTTLDEMTECIDSIELEEDEQMSLDLEPED